MCRSITHLIIFIFSVFFIHTTTFASDLTLTTSGRVSVEFVFSEAAFSNTLSITTAGVAIAARGCNIEPVSGLAGNIIGSEKISQRGCRVDLDADNTTPGIQGFNTGDILQFSMCAQTDADIACEYVWASNSALNTDSFDHVQTSPLFAADYPGQIYQLAWEDLPNGGDNDFNDLIVNVRVANDTDGDGLWDDWETFGIDTNADGTIDLDLPNLLPVDLNGDGDTVDPGETVDPNHKDIFVEIDFMNCAIAGGDCAAGDTHSHQPKQAAIDTIVQAFANAPVANPDGTNGITLRVDVDDAIAHQNQLHYNGGGAVGDFDDVKNNNTIFGANNPRRYAFHYAIFSHREGNTTTSGRAELPGNDLYISLGDWNTACIRDGVNNILESAPTGDDIVLNTSIYTGPDLVCDTAAAGDDTQVVAQTTSPNADPDGDGLDDRTVGTVTQQAGTFMHELGHNLFLQHGGVDSVNYKANYLSVMNYFFQFPGILPTNRYDYSAALLPSLDENNLDETVGIQDGADSTRYYCPDGTINTVAGTGAIDWNCDADSTDLNVVSDINRSGTNTVLNGYDDWTNILYAFQSTSDYEDGVHNTPDTIVEMDNAVYLSLQDQTITIDIKPDSENNPINPGSNGKITVAILSRIDFDAVLMIDASTLTFGHTGDEDSLHIKGNDKPNCAGNDVNDDSHTDLVCHFHTNKTGLTANDTRAILKGKTIEGDNFIANDQINTVPNSSENSSNTSMTSILVNNHQVDNTNNSSDDENIQSSNQDKPQAGGLSIWFMFVTSLILIMRRRINHSKS